MHFCGVMTRMKLYGLLPVLYLCVGWCQSVGAQRENTVSAGYLYLVDSYSGESDQLFVDGSITAAGAANTAPQFILSFTQPYSMSGWWQAGLHVNADFLHHRFRVQVSRQQLGDFRESQAGIVYNRAFGKQVRAGLRLGLNRTRSGPGEVFQEAIYELGALWSPHTRYAIGMLLGRLPVLYPGTVSGKGIPNYFQSQGYIRISDQVGLVFCWEQRPRQPAAVSVSIRYRPLENLMLRFGCHTLFPGYAFGIGFLFHHWRVELSLLQHTVLGLTPGTLLVWKNDHDSP